VAIVPYRGGSVGLPALTPEEYAKQRVNMGCVAVARRIHMMLGRKPHVTCVLDDVAFLQERLKEWGDDGGTPYGKAAKMLVVAAIAEAARDERLTKPAEE
jgi:hypothetical protein